MLLLALVLVTAADGRDVASVGVGAQGAWSEAVGQGDVDILAVTRVSWGLGSLGGAEVRLMADGRFTWDPAPTHRLERSRVRTLGVRLDAEAFTIGLGRQVVHHGGPRLVDGLQVVAHPAPDWDVGAWAGLAPDLFSTRPRLRPGGGPVVAWTHDDWALSAVGEVLWFDGGLDRAGVLAQARYSAGPRWDALVRIDAQLGDGDGRAGLADAAAFVRWRPTPGLDLDAVYDAYSSLRYQRSEHLDPDLRRFDERLDALGLAEGITQDSRDPRLYQLMGATARLRPTSPLVLSLQGRYRWHAEPELRFARLSPRVGLDLLEGHLELAAEGNALWYESELQGDAGLGAMVEPGSAGRWVIDGSVRVLAHPRYGGLPGWYGDLFVDWLGPHGLTLVSGLAVSREPFEGLGDVGVGGYLRLTWRTTRRTDRPRSVPLALSDQSS